ncbi:MAG: hypothetical protein Greene041619_297 [Candidatus Peregrinibacteria bacterium Greene0416_19]|nr:MAG: hypothetical protein Greene041619_297 [Candidatus Peregrinibacteria bacterium Greene0416_19]
MRVQTKQAAIAFMALFLFSLAVITTGVSIVQATILSVD